MPGEVYNEAIVFYPKEVVAAGGFVDGASDQSLDKLRVIVQGDVERLGEHAPRFPSHPGGIRESMRKKKEGNEQQRRQAARDARRAGKRPSAAAATSGASKQRHHLGAHDDPVQKLETIRQGKQQVTDQHVSHPEPRPRSRRWHHDHDHDPQNDSQPRDYQTHPRTGTP